MIKWSGMRLRKLTKMVLLSVFIMTVLAACGKEKEIDYADISYLDKTALDEIGSYKDITSKEYKEANNDFKGEFVKWTATVSKVHSNKKFELKEEELPRIDVKLKVQPGKQLIEEGDLVTIEGKINKYEYGLFDTVPYWVINDAKVLEVTEEEKEAVHAFRTALAERIEAIEVAEIEQTKEEQEKKEAEEKANKERAVETYLTITSKELDEIEEEFDRIWTELWVTTFDGIASGSVDVYTAYDNMKSAKRYYEFLQTQLANVETDKYTEEAKDALTTYKSEYHSTIAKRIDAIKKAMTMFDKGTYKPSEIDKIDSKVASATQGLVKTVAARFTLELALGLEAPTDEE